MDIIIMRWWSLVKRRWGGGCIVVSVVVEAVDNIGSVRTESGSWEIGNGGGQGIALTIIPVATTLLLELLAVLMNNTRVNNKGQ